MSSPRWCTVRKKRTRRVRKRTRHSAARARCPEKTVPADTQTVLQALLATGLCKSNGEARRLVEQGGVSVNGEKVTDAGAALPASPFTLFKGKKVRLKVIVG